MSSHADATLGVLGCSESPPHTPSIARPAATEKPPYPGVGTGQRGQPLEEGPAELGVKCICAVAGGRSRQGALLGSIGGGSRRLAAPAVCMVRLYAVVVNVQLGCFRTIQTVWLSALVVE